MPIENCNIHPSVKIWHPELVNLYGCKIGEGTKIGAFVEIGKGVEIGRDCKIEAYAFLPEGIVIGNNVFIGPHVTFTNTKHPMGDGCYLKTVIENFAIIGANATILPGVLVGANATVGAGSVVTKNVEIGITVVGNPARPIRYWRIGEYETW